MFGYVEWSEARKSRRSVTAEERIIGGVRFCAVSVYRGRGRQAELHRRCGRAARLLRRAGVGRVVLPPGAPEECFVHRGIRPVSDLGLRREVAAELTSFAMAQRGIQPGGATVAVTADRLSAEVIRTVTALCRRCRYLLLQVPYGGEAFCREMRRTQGVSIRLDPTAEQLEQADILLCFAPLRTPPARGKLCLPLYAGAEDVFTWSAAVPGQGGEESRTALLAALWEVGALRPECLEVRSVTFRA